MSKQLKIKYTLSRQCEPAPQGPTTTPKQSAAGVLVVSGATAACVKPVAPQGTASALLSAAVSSKGTRQQNERATQIQGTQPRGGIPESCPAATAASSLCSEADAELDADPQFRRPNNKLAVQTCTATSAASSGEGKLKPDRHAARLATRLKHRRNARVDAERVRRALLNDSDLATNCAGCMYAGCTIGGGLLDYGRCRACNSVLVSLKQTHRSVVVGYHLSGIDDELKEFGSSRSPSPAQSSADEASYSDQSPYASQSEASEDEADVPQCPPPPPHRPPMPVKRTPSRFQVAIAAARDNLVPANNRDVPPPPRPGHAKARNHFPHHLRHIVPQQPAAPVAVLAGLISPPEVVEVAICEFCDVPEVFDMTQVAERVSMTQEQRLVSMRNVPAEKQELVIVRTTARIIVAHWLWALVLPHWDWLYSWLGFFATAELIYSPHLVSELSSLVGPYADGDKIRTNGTAYVNRLASLPLPDYLRDLVVQGSIVVAANMPQRAVLVARDVPGPNPLNYLLGRRRPMPSDIAPATLGSLTLSRSFSTNIQQSPAVVTFGREPRTPAALKTMSRCTRRFLLIALTLTLCCVVCASAFAVMYRHRYSEPAKTLSMVIDDVVLDPRALREKYLLPGADEAWLLRAARASATTESWLTSSSTFGPSANVSYAHLPSPPLLRGG
jgi:hypothetical protein